MVRNKSSTGTVSSWVTFPCLTQLQTWSMSSNLNNKKHHLSCRPSGDWPGYRHPRTKKNKKGVTVHMRWSTGIPTRDIKKKYPCGTVIRKSTDIQPDRRCKIFPNYKKWYLPFCPISLISVFVLAETCSSATPLFLPSLQGSPVAIEKSHAVRDIKICNNGRQTF